MQLKYFFNSSLNCIKHLCLDKNEIQYFNGNVFNCMNHIKNEKMIHFWHSFELFFLVLSTQFNKKISRRKLNRVLPSWMHFSKLVTLILRASVSNFPLQFTFCIQHVLKNIKWRCFALLLYSFYSFCHILSQLKFAFFCVMKYNFLLSHNVKYQMLWIFLSKTLI